MPIHWVRDLAQRDEKRFYRRLVLPWQSLLLTAFAAPMYGFSALIAPVNGVFAPTDPTSGWAGALAGSLMLFGGGFGALLHSQLQRLAGSPQRLLVMLNIAAFAVFGLGALACELNASLLFMLGFALPAGLVFSNLYSLCVAQTVGWARHFKQAGLQSGVIGLAFGVWGAAYSYGGAWLSAEIGLSWTLIATGALVMVIGLLGSLFFLLPTESRVAKSEAASGSSVVLGLRQLIRLTPFWLFFVFFMLFLMPGFGFKIIVQVLSTEAFHATAHVAASIAVAFLITYGLSRLVFGIVADWWGTKPLYLAFAGIQAAALLFAAVSLPSLDSILVFTVLMCFVSSMFAAGKCIWMVALLKIYGPVNFQQAVHATLPAYGLAGFLGPYTLNAALQQSDVLSATSLWLAIMSGALALCFLLFLAIRPVDYGRLAEGRAQRFGLGFGFRAGPDRF